MEAVIVTYRTRDIFAECLASMRTHYPDMTIHVVDGSEEGNPCHEYVKKIADRNTIVHLIGRNIGHGRGMAYGLKHCTGENVLLVDSDAIVVADPLPIMREAMTENIYAVGEIYKIGLSGLHRDPSVVPYVRPYFMLLNRAMYYQWPPFIHHGSPCIKPMRKIWEAGKSDEMLRHIELIPKYIRHDWGATRQMNRARGLPETPMQWDKIG